MRKYTQILSSIRLGTLVLFSLVGTVVEAHASVKDMHEIIDICTSSERIMKDYALVGMRIVYHDPKKDLDTTVKHLDEEMEMLESHHLTKNLHSEEEALQKVWSSIEKNVTKISTKENALVLRHHIDAFAMQCEKLAEDLAKDTGNPAEHDIVLIARLNLNVQELAGDYVMKAWDAMGDEEYYKDVKAIKEDYQKDFEELEGAEDKLVPPKVKAHLKMLDKHFMMFEFMTESHSGRFIPLLIAKKANKINEETMKILNEDESEEEK